MIKYMKGIKTEEQNAKLKNIKIFLHLYYI